MMESIHDHANIMARDCNLPICTCMYVMILDWIIDCDSQSCVPCVAVTWPDSLVKQRKMKVSSIFSFDIRHSSTTVVLLYKSIVRSE